MSPVSYLLARACPPLRTSGSDDGVTPDVRIQPKRNSDRDGAGLG